MQNLSFKGTMYLFSLVCTMLCGQGASGTFLYRSSPLFVILCALINLRKYKQSWLDSICTRLSIKLLYVFFVVTWYFTYWALELYQYYTDSYGYGYWDNFSTFEVHLHIIHGGSFSLRHICTPSMGHGGSFISFDDQISHHELWCF